MQCKFSSNSLMLLVVCSSMILVSSQETCAATADSDGCGAAAVDDSQEHDSEEPLHKYKEESNNHWSFLQLAHEMQRLYHPPARNCSCHFGQIKVDLHQHRQGIKRQQVIDARARGVLYQVMGGQLYREEQCMFPSRCVGVEHFLQELAPDLPDTELVINVRDWPQVNTVRQQEGSKATAPLPVFSFSKQSRVHGDILYPTWSFWEGGPAIALHPTGLGRWDVRRKTIIKAANKYKWSKKQDKAFFRGSRTSSNRDSLVLLSREEPQVADAAYTKNQAWKSDEDTLGAPPAEEVSLENHCQYKYLFNFHGVAASFRFKHLFLCGSVVFHETDGWIEFFYPQLKPWVHYIPVPSRPTKQEIKDLIEFARDNDDLVRDIARAGRDFIADRLGMADVKCYWSKLIKTYTKLLKFKPKLSKEVTLVAVQKLGTQL